MNLLLARRARMRLDATAADRVVVDTKTAAAADLEHAGHAFAARLDHLAAGLVAAGASDADAGRSHLAFAHAHGEVAGADGQAVQHHGATDHAAGHHGAEVLHHGAGRLVVADAGDLHAAGAFFHFHGATRDHEPLRAGRHVEGHATGRTHGGHVHCCPFHHHVRHERTPLKVETLYK
jgi:hypothetical protein